jgi:hypothetical protein
MIHSFFYFFGTIHFSTVLLKSKNRKRLYPKSTEGRDQALNKAVNDITWSGKTGFKRVAMPLLTSVNLRRYSNFIKSNADANSPWKATAGLACAAGVCLSCIIKSSLLCPPQTSILHPKDIRYALRIFAEALALNNKLNQNP